MPLAFNDLKKCWSGQPGVRPAAPAEARQCHKRGPGVDVFGPWCVHGAPPVRMPPPYHSRERLLYKLVLVMPLSSCCLCYAPISLLFKDALSIHRMNNAYVADRNPIEILLIESVLIEFFILAHNLSIFTVKMFTQVWISKKNIYMKYLKKDMYP